MANRGDKRASTHLFLDYLHKNRENPYINNLLMNIFPNIIHQHLQQLHFKASRGLMSSNLKLSSTRITQLIKTKNFCREGSYCLLLIGIKMLLKFKLKTDIPKHRTYQNCIQLSICMFTTQSFFDSFNDIFSLSAYLKPEKEMLKIST